MPARRKHLYQFGDFYIDINERVLLSEQKPIALAPKVFETLLLLVENSGYILEKNEIIEKIWPDTFVEEGNLAIYISQIRKVLGDNAGNPNFIETIPKRGYRFIAPVTEIKDSELESQDRLITAPAGAPDELVVATSSTAPTSAPTSKNSYQTSIDDLEPVISQIDPDIANSDHLQQMIAAEIDNIDSQSDEHLVADAQSAPIITSRPVITGRANPARILIIVMAVIIALVGSVVLIRQIIPRQAPFQQIDIKRLTTNGQIKDAAISPDGKYVAFIQRTSKGESLWLRQIDSTSAIELVSPANTQLRDVVFNPAGTKIYYLARPAQQSMSLLYEIPFFGGTPLKIVADIDSRISFSPDGERFVFVRGNPTQNQSELIVCNLNGSGERRLSVRPRNNPFSYDGPAWSPDGKVIAIAAGTVDLGNPNMMVLAIDADSGNSRTITQQPWSWVGTVSWLADSRGLIMPGWQQEAPIFTDQLWYLNYSDGKYHAVTHDLDRYSSASVAANLNSLVTIQHNRQSRLYIMPLSTTATPLSDQAEIQISNGFGDIYSDWFGLSWTPDGRILYGSNAGDNTDIWLLDPINQTQQQLTRDIHGDLTPSIARDNGKLIFCSYATGKPHIFAMDLDGGNLKQMTNGRGEIRPDISPDGSWFVYTSVDVDKRTIWRASLTGDQSARAISNNGFNAVISPDGKRIAYQQANNQSGINIVIVDANGGEPLATLADLGMQPGSLIEWMPDSSGIAFIKQENGVANIWSKPINGELTSRLTNFTADQIYRFAFSLDGKRLACERGIVVSDLVLIKEKRD